MDDVATVTVDAVPAGAVLLDVREDDEWAAGHAPGARHIPMSGLLARADEVPRDGDVVVVCKVGARSAQVAAYLRSRGWDNVRNLDGGMLAWQRAGRPMTSETDAAPAVI